MPYMSIGATTPLEDPPIIEAYPGLDELRRQTHWFIMNDPTPIVLTPRDRAIAPGGGWNAVDLTPRPEQIFKMIFQSGVVDGVVATADGQDRRYDFVILGEWDCTLGIGDYWVDALNDHQFWTIAGLQPYNGYEVKAGVLSYGRDPQHG